ncbi:MAG: hypothetical protein COX30_00270 [Candidatus Moranbacteria bacterium CG23_combo_of_CG06-09_8_20_14_all_39_10]|nr:MAG: hypothetical protein COX30_00270 [Candidatus Moranbacteria bacterium CG23_combo_of_CG06-09_8_20_14_all_39_10]
MNTNLYIHEEKRSVWRSNFSFSVAVLLMLVLSGGVLWFLRSGLDDISEQTVYTGVFANRTDASEVFVPEDNKKQAWHFSPEPISMDLIKNNGCVADGFLSGYGDKTSEIAKTINRSKCVYLHRALETWLKPPDFAEAVVIMEKIDKKPLVYGMFLAEAISTRKKYTDPVEGERHYFEKMCREGTEGRWGNDTCVPTIQKVEYRRYLKAITHRAMDMGIQSFLFGQIQLQDEHPNSTETEIIKIIADMRQYAQERGMQIIIGAQTDDITDEKYLRLFDYIEGGVGIDDQGRVENQPCSSNHVSCWALLWDKKYSTKANNVLLHLDWSGLTWDDMGIFARMPADKRSATLTSLYRKFTSQKMGFMMPFLAVLNHDNDGCYGPNKNFYTPSEKYKCKDEADINAIMREPAL